MPIPRRSFLKTVAASAFPAAALHDLIAQVPSAPQTTSGPHIVGNGQDRLSEKHSLGYSSMGFKVGTSETGGNMFVVEHTNLMPGKGPGLHLHLNQEEWFYVMEGQVAFQVGEQRIQLNAGESILGPRRVSHAFSAVGNPARLLIAFSPAGKMEQFFREVERDQKLLMDAEFNSRFEMKLVGPSPFWKS